MTEEETQDKSACILGGKTSTVLYSMEKQRHIQYSVLRPTKIISQQRSFPTSALAEGLWQKNDILNGILDMVFKWQTVEVVESGSNHGKGQKVGVRANRK